MNATATFSQLLHLSISGDSSLKTKITCTPDAGLELRSIESITVTNITISHCGALLSTTASQYKSAVTILRGRDVKLTHIAIMNSIGVGLVILDHQGGNVHIETSMFVWNGLPKNDSAAFPSIIDGGGVYVGGFEQDPLEPLTLKFDDCEFNENIAHTRYYPHLYTSDLGQSVSGHGLGGGVAIILERRLTDIHIKFTGCTFTKNEASTGAGLVSEIMGTSNNVSVTVEDSLFEDNGCSLSNPTAYGGGMRIGFNDTSDTFTLNGYTLSNVTFKNNCAHFGGGVYFSSFHKRSADSLNSLEIEECTFEYNKAHTGSAVEITPNVFQRFSQGILLTPVFRDCTFSNNRVENNVNPKHNQVTYGIATLYVTQYSIKLEGNNSFENNYGTAIHIVNGNIDMSQSSVTFSKNIGVRGGAIALLGIASVIIGQHRRYEFVNNIALEEGGALFVSVIDSHDITATKECFIRYIDRISMNNTITFVGNTAKSGRGHSIFATSLYPCQVLNTGTKQEPCYELIDIKDVFKARGIIFRDKLEPDNGYHIATEGAILIQNYSNIRKGIVPGELFEHGASFVDDLGNKAVVALTKSTPKLCKCDVLPDTTYSLCFGKSVSVKGQENTTDFLNLQTISVRLSYIQLNVTLLKCPPGFVFNKKTSTCVCDHKSYVGLVMCNKTSSYITPGFWIGMVQDSRNESKRELVTSYCFLYFCKYNDSCNQGSPIKLPKMANQLNEAMCGRSRRGVACGSCAPNYTTYFHSPTYQCKPVDPTLCKLGWFFYITSELIPVTVVFIAVIFFNINFTSGTVNGFILFSQLLYSFNFDSSGLITFPPAITKFFDGSRLVYGFLSLDFFQAEALSFCLFPSASALDVVAFKYVTIVYAFVMVIVVILFMNKCGGRCLGKCCRITTVKSSVIHGISAFLILCYSQCIRISFNLLDNFGLYVKSGSTLTVSRRAWLNGDVTYFSGKHLLYALPAFFCLLTIGIIPPALLVAYPLFNKVLALLRVEDSTFVRVVSQKVHISSLKPLLDTFQGCFKDDMRFFAGLYFIYRWIAQITSVAPSSGFSIYDISVNILLTIVLSLHALCQPYAQRRHNIIDTLLLTNLTVITAISFFHLYVFRARISQQTAVNRITGSAVLQLILICLPLLVISVYTAVSVYKLGCRRKSKDKNDLQQRSTWSLSTKLKKLVNPVLNSESSSDTDELPHRLVGENVDYEQF